MSVTEVHIVTSVLEFEKEVLVQLNQLNQRMEDILTGVNRLRLHVLPDEKVIGRPKGMPTTPIRTMALLEKFEKYLDNEDNMAMTVSSCV